MKTITFAILLAMSIGSLFAQKIQYKQTSISITNDAGFSTNANEIRYNVSANLVDSDTLASLFPGQINEFRLVNGKLQYTSYVVVPDMWQLIKTMKIQQTDLDVYVYDAIVNWSTNILYYSNLLNLNTSNWYIIK